MNPIIVKLVFIRTPLVFAYIYIYFFNTILLLRDWISSLDKTHLLNSLELVFPFQVVFAFSNSMFH